MKRSRSVRLVLLGGLSTAALAGCGPRTDDIAPITANSAYTNNYFVPGVGYYHAPFRAWFSLPYNHFDPGNHRYYYGGEWAAAPHQSIINISTPRPEVAQRAEAQRTDVTRGGFGGTAHGYFFGG